MNRPDRPDRPDRDPVAELQKVLEELDRLPTSYSQSNPGIYMAHRDLNKKRAVLEAEISKLKK
jgi:hypothetical protein